MRGFFRYHGVWAPGVRLFRRLSFLAKASIVSVAFLIPLCVLGWSFNAGKQADLDFVLAEREGIQYGQAINRFAAAVLSERSVASGEIGVSLDALKAESDLAWQAVAQQEAAHGRALSSAKPFDALSRSQQATRQALVGQSPDALDQLYERVLQAQSVLLEQVVDKSNLALDPEFSSYYLMDASMIAAPDLMLSAARLRALMVNVIKAGRARPADMVALDRESAAVARRVAQVKVSMGKAAQDTPGLQDRLPVSDLEAASGKLVALADAVVHGEPVPTDNQAVTHWGSQTVRAARALAEKGMPELDTLLAQREAGLSGARAWVNGLTGLCLLAAVYLLLCFYRVTRGGMEEVRHHLSAMTDGDLTTSPKPWGKDEAASLMNSLSMMQEALRSVVSNVREASDVIVHSSTEIASGAMDLSARTERMASNLQESASSMEEIAATVRQTAEHAGEASRLAAGNAGVAVHGGTVIHDVEQTMQGINHSSGKIADIISVIDGIAFQTNILALNAAVEAARAGEQGRGFAVVAGEVRALAQRSATAAREIKALIEASTGKVNAGAEVVRDAGQTMHDIVAHAKQMDKLLAEIARGAEQESLGVSQVGQAVLDLDRVTQENAALVEETAAASESLKQQAHALARAVAVFRLP